MLLNQHRFPHGSLRLLWELVEQGYEVEFSLRRDEMKGQEIVCHLRLGEKESTATSNNVAAALYVAYHNFKKKME